MLLDIFKKELDNVEPATPSAAGTGLQTPTREELEDTLFDEYLPTLTADDFAPADVENYSNSFLDHWLAKLEALEFVPKTFNLQTYRPEDRTAEVNAERTRVLDEWFDKNIQNLMFQFMLDDFTQAIGGPHAKVRQLPMILPGGYARSLSPEDWLKTLDIPQYKIRLVDHLTTTSSWDIWAKIDHSASCSALRLTRGRVSNRWPRCINCSACSPGPSRRSPSGCGTIRRRTWSPKIGLIVFDPYKEYKRMASIAAAAQDFYRDIGPALDNDEALIKVLDRMVAAVSDSKTYGSAWALALRLTKMATAFKERVEDQRKRTREAIEARGESLVRDDLRRHQGDGEVRQRIPRKDVDSEAARGGSGPHHRERHGAAGSL